jgi:hypothetical protein
MSLPGSTHRHDDECMAKLPQLTPESLECGANFRELGSRVVFPATMHRSLTFEAWKALLRNDCIADEKLQAFDAPGDAILRILHENGADPTVEGVVHDGLSGKPPVEPIIRCPYCNVGNVFRPMLERIEGWFRCDICGHNAMPLDSEFTCACSNATLLSHILSRFVVEIKVMQIK